MSLNLTQQFARPRQLGLEFESTVGTTPERVDNSDLSLEPCQSANPENLAAPLHILTERPAGTIFDQGRSHVHHLVGRPAAPRELLWNFLCWYRGNQLAPNEHADTEKYTPQPLLQSQRGCRKRHAAVLNNNNLHTSVDSRQSSRKSD